MNVNLNNPMEIRAIGMKALKDALGPVGLVKFMQQCEPGYGDYTKEKQDAPALALDELDTLLRKQGGDSRTRA